MPRNATKSIIFELWLILIMEINAISETTLKVLRSNPNALIRMLSETEYQTLCVLYVSDHALTSKAVQRAVIESLLQADFLKLTGKGTNRLIAGQPTNKIIELARTRNLSPPSDATITRALESLVLQGFVGKRLTAEGSRANALYFFNPALLEIKGLGVKHGQS
jgi:hypothetical protein